MAEPSSAPPGSKRSTSEAWGGAAKLNAERGGSGGRPAWPGRGCSVARLTGGSDEGFGPTGGTDTVSATGGGEAERSSSGEDDDRRGDVRNDAGTGRSEVGRIAGSPPEL